MLSTPPGPITYEEGKAIEDFARAWAIEAAAQNVSVMHAVTASIPYDFGDQSDHFAVGYWPSRNLMIVKSTGGPQLGVLPNRDTEKRATLAVQALAGAGVRVDLDETDYYEVQRMRDMYYVSRIVGLSNSMRGLVADYARCESEEIETDVLLLSERI